MGNVLLLILWLLSQQRQLELLELERSLPSFANSLQCKPCHLAKNNDLKMERWYQREGDPRSKGMKRFGDLYQRICTLENLELADTIARKGKRFRREVLLHDLNRELNLLALQTSLVSRTYQTSEYNTFKVFEPKERIVYRLPFYPDRIAHHAIMNVLESYFVSFFTADTYSSIKGRGIHSAASALRKALRNEPETRYCLKLDIEKFYPSVDHQVLKDLLARKFKDRDLLWLLYEIVDSAEGLPIGNYLSQYLANFYLTGLDHMIKQDLRIKNYFRYADDLVILGSNKAALHNQFSKIAEYLDSRLLLKVKSNYQVFPVASRSIDFVGYRFYHTHTLLRKSIKKNFARMLSANRNPASVASYWGWAKHCNSNHLMKKFLNHEYYINNYSKS